MTTPQPTPEATADQTGQRCRVKVGSTADVLAVVPHLLGFQPAGSLVVLGVGGPHARIRLTFRYDLPDPPDAELAADIAAHAVSVLQRQRLRLAIAIGYGPGPTVSAVMDLVGPALHQAGIKAIDLLRVHDGRYWSYTCTEPACCPAAGVPFDSSGHPVATALAAAGLTVRGSRAELAATLAAAAPAGEGMRQAVHRARNRAAQLVTDSLAASASGDAFQAVADAGRRCVRTAVTTYRRGGQLTDLDEIAWLGVTLTDLRVRDDAWARMDAEFNTAHQRLWVDLVRQLPAEYVPAPASLLAFTAWQAGDGALANVAVERALAADPDYSMAHLIAEAVAAGLPPSAARLPMTPKQVAAAYARRRSAGSSGQRPPATARKQPQRQSRRERSGSAAGRPGQRR
jgi:hypothetical protein